MKGQLKVSTPAEYIAKLDEPRKSEITKLDAFIRKHAPNLRPCVMMGVLAYGPYRYTYESGRSGDSARVGLASNAQYISLYICASNDRGYLPESYKKRLGKASVGKCCVRFKRFADLDAGVLAEMLRESDACSQGCDVARKDARKKRSTARRKPARRVARRT